VSNGIQQSPQTRITAGCLYRALTLHNVHRQPTVTYVDLPVTDALQGGVTVMLTDTAIRNAKPRELPYKLGDSRGLYLLVTPSGGKW